MIKRKIMVVDDSQEARAAIERILVRAGYEVTPATSGREALYILKQKKIDCILIDHLMPEMTGLEVIRFLKSDERLKIIPVVMLTGLEGEDDIVAGLSAGADDYLFKTSSSDIILARVEAMLRLGKLQGELFEKNLLYEKANEELRRLDILKSEFVSTVSHELRTPLSITKEGLKLVLEEVTGSINQQQRELLEVAKSNIERLGKIINDILDISKIEAGKMSLHKSLVDMTQLVRNVFLLFQNKAEQQAIKLSISVPESKLESYVDGDRIVQVLNNLVANALKFNKEDGNVKIKLDRSDKEMLCSVEDDGIGIAKEDKDKIFDKFQQLHKTPGSGERGTGLGLSISKKIIQLHRGMIWVDSDLGKGAKFTFSLPCYSREDILREFVHARVKDSQDRLGKFTVIIVNISGGCNPYLLEAIEARIKESLRCSGDNVLAYADKVFLFLSDTDKRSTEAVEKRILSSCQAFVRKDKRFKKKINFKINVTTYPEDVLTEEDLLKGLLG